MTIARLARWFGTGSQPAAARPGAWPAAMWRAAAAADWPPCETLGDDFDWARRTGSGFVAEFEGKRWFLFHRDWFGWPDPPEWSLASFAADGEGWRFHDDFDLLPENWVLPKARDAQD